MDSDFLEFWGNLLVNASKGQRKIEEINEWISQGLRGSDELSNMILSFYGLGGKKEDPPSGGDDWAEVSKAFLDSYHEYIQLMGMVPKSEYDELVEKNKKLEKKCREQEEAIEHLKGLINTQALDPSNTIEDLQQLISNQSEQFHRLMQGFNKAMRGSGKEFNEK